MSAAARKIETADILPLEEYGKLRAERRKKISQLKKNRRLEVGPVATFYFESYDTMLHQVHEMLFIEKGGGAQVPDELAAYNPLIPAGAELVATVMFEIDDPLRRARILAGLGGVERTAFIRVDGQMVKGVPEEDQDRNATPKAEASSVQFIRFPFTAMEIDAFRSERGEIVVGFSHPNYAHMAIMPADGARAARRRFRLRNGSPRDEVVGSPSGNHGLLRQVVVYRDFEGDAARQGCQAGSRRETVRI